MALAILTVSE